MIRHCILISTSSRHFGCRSVVCLPRCCCFVHLGTGIQFCIPISPECCQPFTTVIIVTPTTGSTSMKPQVASIHCRLTSIHTSSLLFAVGSKGSCWCVRWPFPRNYLPYSPPPTDVRPNNSLLIIMWTPAITQTSLLILFHILDCS